MKAIWMSLVLPVVEVVEPLLAPLMLELHASSSPPPPTTAALAPAARNRPRRLRPPSRLSLLLPGCAVWSLMLQSISFEVAPRRGTASEVTPQRLRNRAGEAAAS